jgi:hypothetical protein
MKPMNITEILSVEELASVGYNHTFKIVHHHAFFIFADKLTTDYSFTFNLTREENKYITRINFMNMPSGVSSVLVMHSSGL